MISAERLLSHPTLKAAVIQPMAFAKCFVPHRQLQQNVCVASVCGSVCESNSMSKVRLAGRGETHLMQVLRLSRGLYIYTQQAHYATLHYFRQCNTSNPATKRERQATELSAACHTWQRSLHRTASANNEDTDDVHAFWLMTS